MQEKIKIRVTKPDGAIYTISFTGVEIKMHDEGILITRNCSRLVMAFYPLNYSIEIINVEVIGN
jgi:hypothetical protein